MQITTVSNDGTYVDNITDLERIVHKVVRRSQLPLKVVADRAQCRVDIFLKDTLKGFAVRHYSGRVEVFMPDGPETATRLYDPSEQTVERSIAGLVTQIVAAMLSDVHQGDPTA